MDMHWFDHFPEPVFYTHNGQLQYSNAAGAALLSGDRLPPELAMEPDEEGVFSCVLGGQEYQAAVTRAGEGMLLVLRPAVKASAGELLTALPIQLRELINNIQATTRLLTPLAEERGGEDARRNLAVLNQSFYRLLRLARHLELAARVTPDSLPLQEQTLDLADLCREVAYGASALAQQAGVEFRTDIPGGMTPGLGDRQLLEVMLLELISNAVKAAGRGGKAGIRMSSNASSVLICVWDNGSGVTQAELTAITDGASPDSLPKPGTGLRLGLPIARRIAQAHGGALLMENRSEGGLRVTVSLPLRKGGKGSLRTPCVQAEEGFSPFLTLLADSLPWEVFED